jgi:hypothetical protein
MKINLIFIICLVSGSILFDDLNESLKIVPTLENSDWNDIYITFIGSAVGVFTGISLNFIIDKIKKNNE